ncbi:sensor domain-containing diguanylate cyclase [Aromatoleum sp.]|uniref:sensor domain-containing diguanylate cyclase n=1 Tax=Aromatoleum sp. TaxID=2307007 RepID=UPI002FC825B1
MNENLIVSGSAPPREDRLQLESLIEVIQQLSMARDLDRIMKIVRRAARRLSGADGATFVLREGDLCYYADEDAVSPLWKGQRFPMESCISGWVMKHGQPVAIEDVDVDPRVNAEAFRRTVVKSMLMVPIRSSDPLGAIGNYWAHRHRPGGGEMRMLQALANSTAVALENVLLYSDLEKRVKERTEALEREISERRQAEEMLRESRQRFACVVESAMDAIISIDGAQRIVFFNAAAEAMFRWRAPDVVGRAIDCLIPERFRTTHGDRVREFMAGGVTSRTVTELQQLRGVRSDGEEFPIEAAFSKVELAGGVLSTVIVRDVSRRVATEAALARSEAQLRYVTDAGEIGYWDWDVIADRLEWSERCKVMFGIPVGEPVTYERFLGALHPDDRDRVDAAVHAALAGDCDYDVEIRTIEPRASARWVHSKGRSTFGPDGAPLRMGGIALDITTRKEMEAALRESEARFRNMADTAPAMLWVTEPDGHCSFLSRGWYDYTGQAHDAGVGFGWLDAVHPDDRDKVTAGFLAASGERNPFEHEHRVRCADGEYRWVLDAGRPRFADDGTFLGYIGSVIDITERKHGEEIMRKSALHDPLTNLPNRALTHEFADHLLAASRRARACSAVMFIDLDRFKPINDTYGHHVGDAVLKEVANRLQHCVRGEDVVGRLGGDEFVAVLSHIHRIDEATSAATHVLARLSEPYEILGNGTGVRLELSPSIGISLFPEHGEDLASLIECADVAMYAAKTAGRGTFRFYRDADKGRSKD